ncbi:MAG: outer membrane lipoprotein-sorting protein, partial [Acidobacteriales bacterium]|nr:outer membrane lipoprotein-sorting protein [Terriglobales bacterium]
MARKTTRNLIAVLALSTATAALAQTPSDPKLEQVLTQMDQASQRFKSATADFSWDQFQKVVEEHDIQSGKIFFRRTSKEVQMAADIDKPIAKKLVYSGGKVQFFQPSINQLTERDAGSNRADVESFLVLGFGGRGHDLLKQWQVTLSGEENIGNTQTVRLELIPKAENIKHIFNKVVIWVDPE